MLKWLSLGVIYLYPIASADLAKIADLTRTYADLPMDFADGCLVALAEKLKISQIATIDSDFQIYRVGNKLAFKNIFNDFI